MAQKFEEKDFPLINIIINSCFILNKRIKKPEVQNLIFTECLNELLWKIPNQNDIKYFDFKLKTDKFADEIKIVPSNILTALWFINIFPINGREVIKNKKYISLTHTYKFNGRSKRLIIQ